MQKALSSTPKVLTYTGLLYNYLLGCESKIYAL